MTTGQAHELALAFARNGWTSADVKSLSIGSMLADVLLVAKGFGRVEIIKHVIDLTSDPFIPQGLEVYYHEKGASDFEWDPTKIRLHFSANQMEGKSVEGNHLRKELANESPLNANLLDYLLKNPNLIPEEWKADEAGETYYIYFWGTIYIHPDGSLHVRCLCWCDNKWDWGKLYLDHPWESLRPAVCFVK